MSVDKNKEHIVILKRKNPFITLLYTYPMYGFYAIALFSITFIDAPVLNKIYFSGFLFLMFYSLTIIVSPFYIYTSLKYGNIVIYNQNKIITKNKTYANSTHKCKKSPQIMTLIV